ncbi:SpoIIE family protein phosphatase [Streptomyces litchfieldiae]|uniref:SpoIIE family protein phosphatase n=1 Tax=Streptomyces litchfieldiae TaxID=3075543 RepID=UPI00374E1B44
MASDEARPGPGLGYAPRGGPGPLEVANAATVVIGPGGTILGWTRAAEELLGYPAAEVVGRSAAMLLTAPGDRLRAAAVARRCRTGASWAGTATVRTRDGRRVEAQLRVSPPFSLDDRECFLVSAGERQPSHTVSESVLEGLLTRSPIGMAVMDTELRYVWMNDTLERAGGVPREQRLGRRLSDLLPGLDAEQLEALMREVRDTRTPVIDHEYTGWSWADPQRLHAYSTSFFPLVDDEDRVMGVCYLVMDVTDRWEARQRLGLINEASGRIGSTLDIERTAQELADVAVPSLADFAAVDLLEPVLHGDEPAVLPVDPRPLMRRCGLRSVHEGAPEAVARLGEQVGFLPPHHDSRYLADEDAMLIPSLDPDDEAWAREYPERARTMREFGLHSLLAVPLRARGVVLGQAVFLRSRNPAPFVPDDLLLARELVDRAAVCVDNARRYSRERAAALALQRSMLPRHLTGGIALDVASRYLPARIREGGGGVGGDWFDVIPLSGARAALVVGDVVGHGVTAAVTMGRLRTAVRTLADMELPPEELLAHLDDWAIRVIEEEAGDQAAAATVLGATCLYAVYDPIARRCTLARAGHPPPAVVTPDGDVTFPELPAGPPLGLGGLPFEPAEFELPEGSLIALYSDGLVESPDQDIDAGMARLGRVLARPGLSLDELCTAATQSLGPGPPFDDVTLLLARTHALTAERVASFEFPSDPAVVAQARARTGEQLAHWGLENLTMTVELLVSELVTNAIRYASGPVRLRLIRQSVLTCEVADASSTSPRLRHPRTLDEGGRGLFLVAQLARRWGTRYVGDGKIIWAELDVRPAQPGDDRPARERVAA